MPRPKPQLVIPLDNCSENEAKTLAVELADAGVAWFKVGLELYTQAGPRMVEELKKSGFKVFLDLKLHDIPNTVGKAVKAAVSTGADLLTVHASGGADMLAAARDAAAGSPLSIVAVTVLTSFGDDTLASVGRSWGAAALSRTAVVENLARLAAASRIQGIVCSAVDIENPAILKLEWPAGSPLLVTPGLRNSGDARDDQKSVATITQAVKLGATHLVMGRPITAPSSGTRAQAAVRALKEIGDAHVLAPHP